MDDVTAKLLRGRDRAVRRADGQADRRASRRRREAVVTGRPDAIRPPIPDELEPALAERVQQRRRGGRGAARLAQGRVALGRPGRARDRQPARLADDRREMLEEADELEAFAERVPRRGLDRRGAARHGRLEPRARGDPPDLRQDGGRRCACTCSTRPTRARCSPSSARSTSSSTLFIVSSKSGGTIETLSHVALLLRRKRRTRRRATSSPSPTRAARWTSSRERARLPARVPRTTRTSAAATRRCPTSASCRPRWRAWTSGRCSTARRWPSRRCQHYDQRASNSGPLARPGDRRAGARRAATRLTFVVAEPIASFGLWVEQLIAESTGKQGKGILPVADEPLGDAGRLRRRPRVRAPAQRRRARRGTPPSRRSPRRPPDDDASTSRAPPTSAGSSSSPSSRPPSPAGCSASTRSTSRTCRRPRTTPTRCSTSQGGGSCPTCRTPATTRCARCSTRPRRRTTWRSWATSSPRTRSTRRSSELRARIRDATRRPPRSATARASCTPPASSTRAARRRACSSSSCTTATRTSRSRRAGYSFGTLKNAQATGDLHTLRAHGLPAERVRLDGDPAAALEQLTDEDQGDALMQIGFVGLGQDGREHGPPDPPRLGPRGRRVRPNQDAVARGGGLGARGAASLEDLVAKLETPRSSG